MGMTGRTALRITVDRDLCIGAGQCVISEPQVFDQDQEGLVVVLVDELVLSPDHSDPVRQAVRRCPTQALGLAD